MANTFSFDNAAFHMFRTEGPGGFIWKYLIAYGLVIFVFAAISMLMMGPLFSAYGEMMAAAVNGASEQEMDTIIMDALLANVGQLALGYIASLIFGVVFWAAFEAAIQRRYVRDEGFGLRFGGDELRLIVVGLIWIAMLIGGMIVSQLAIMGLILPVVSIASENPMLIGLWGFVVVLAVMVLWLVMLIRLSAASALTIRDRKIHFFASWSVTKGRFWPMLGAYLILLLILGTVVTVIYMLGFGVIVAAMIPAFEASGGAEPDPEALIAMFTSPAVIVGLVIWYCVLLLFQGFSGYAWAGVAALAAKTDPKGGGMVNAADHFG